MNKNNLLIGWGIKLGFSILYIIIFTYYFSDGTLIYGDSRNFLNDAKELALYGERDWFNYLKLLLGFGTDTPSFVAQELSKTEIWSFGDNGDFINDNRLMIKLNSLIYFISRGNIWIHTLFFAAISYAGTLLIYKTFESLVKNKKLLFFGLLCFPTVSFWAGGITKETILIFSLGVFFFNLKHLTFNKAKAKNLLSLIVAIGLLLFNKPYVGILIILLSPLIIFLLKYKLNKLKGIAIIGGLLIGFIITSLTPNRVNIVNRLSYKQNDLQNLGNGGVFFINDSAFCAFDYEEFPKFDFYKEEMLISVKEPLYGEYKLFGESEFYSFKMPSGDKKYEVYHVIAPSSSLIEVEPINYSVLQLFKNTPLALANVLIRPLPNDPGDQIKIISFIENLLFMCFIIFVIIKRRTLNDEEKSWMFYLTICSIVLILIVGWSTPILGAIVRYKMASHLLLFISLIILLKPFSNENKRSIN